MSRLNKRGSTLLTASVSAPSEAQMVGVGKINSD